METTKRGLEDDSLNSTDKVHRLHGREVEERPLGTLASSRSAAGSMPPHPADDHAEDHADDHVEDHLDHSVPVDLDIDVDIEPQSTAPVPDELLAAAEPSSPHPAPEPAHDAPLHLEPEPELPPAELAADLERRLAQVDDDDKVPLYKQLGKVLEDLGRERAALDAWLAADHLGDGSDLDTLHSLARLYRSAQAWDELADTLRRILDAGQLQDVLGEQDTIDLYAELAQLEGDVLGHVEEAIDAWRQVVSVDPSDLRALQTLETLYVREARWQESIDVLEKRALVCEDDDQRRETLLQAAATWEEKVKDLARAAEVYERLRKIDSADLAASERLAVIYRHQRKWTELVEVLLERSEAVTEAARQVDLLNEVARVYETELDDAESAFYVLQAAFNRDYKHAPTAQGLERIATATKRWQELLDEYTKRVNELEREDRAAAADLWVKIGRWYGEHLSHRDYAIHSVQQALRLDPAHLGALSAIAELQRERGSASALVDTLQRHAAVETDPVKRTELLVQLADLLERQGDTAGAILAYQQALDHQAASKPALAALDRLFRATEQWEPLLDVLGRRAELETDDASIVALRVEIGRVADAQLGEAGLAIAAYRQALDIDPHQPDALLALEQLYDRTGQHEKYLEVLEAQLDICESTDDRIALYERMAQAWEERFAKLDRAAAAYANILAIDARNEHAHVELARLHRQTAKWEALVETYQRHAAATADARARIDLTIAMAVACEQNLSDLDRAIEAYNDVLQLDADEPRALEALGRLYEKTERWSHAVDAMGRQVQLVDDARKQVELYTRIGRIQYAQLGDAEAAEASLLGGLAVDPTYIPAMEALTKQYSDRGDWQKAAQMMVRADSYTEVVVDRVRLLFEAARIYHDHLHQEDNAEQLYAAVIALDPEHVDAGRLLAQLYFARQEWAVLSPVIEMLVRKVARMSADPHLIQELYYRAARCADELGELGRAQQHYAAAYAIDPTHLPTLTGHADLLAKKQDWDAAARLYQSILVQSRDTSPAADVARVYTKLGLVHQAQGDRKKALDAFDKALEHEPGHAGALQAVIELQQQQGEWDAVVRAKRALMATASAKEKLGLLDEIGSIYHDKLANSQKATAVYLEALELAPDDHQLLQKLLDFYTETKQWKHAIETIERFAALEADAYRKGVYFHAAATLCRDELKSIDDAIGYYTRALDSFFAQPEKLDDKLLGRALKSFEAIDKALTTKRDWRAQEHAYAAMINRVPETGGTLFHKLQVVLFDGLGEIYRSRLKNHDCAISSFEVSQQLDPDNALRTDGTDRAEILAELYVVAGPDHADKAITQHVRMLSGEPFKYDSYKALARIYKETNQHDKRWCLCSTLAFLKKASPEEFAFYDQYKPRGMMRAKRPLTNDSWDRLAHPDENRTLSTILAACSPAVSALKAFSHKDLGIKREERRQLQDDSLMFSKLFVYVAQSLNVPLPEVYLVDDGKQADIQLANAIDRSELCPSFVVRPQMLQGKSERELAFMLTRKLAFMRPEYYPRMLLPTTTELQVIVLSAIAMMQPGYAVPGNMVATVDKYLPQLRKAMPKYSDHALAAAVQQIVQTGADIDLAKWGHAVDATSRRAGYVMCGDLEVAARTVAVDPDVMGAPSVKDKLKDLALFSISEDYFAVRWQVGLAIGG
jgi:tetratricopeptide (TPR) repeat protein